MPDYAEEKYALVKLYCHLFTKSMRAHWDELIYLDLFAGAGRSRVRGSERILPGSPFLALDMDVPFDQYVFCEADRERIGVLQQRVQRDFRGRVVRYVEGDINENVDVVLAALPSGSQSRRVLSFCFVDPYSLQNLKFKTIKLLSERYMDFLVLIPTGYDANRNWEQKYLTPEDETVEDFLGDAGWRKRWEESRARNESVDAFLTDAFGASMTRLGFYYPGIGDTHLMRVTVKNVRLYRLALFSRSRLGVKFWRQVRKYAPDQRSLF